MLTPQEQKQYNRHILLKEIGEIGQLKLKQAKVLVIGAGGLGCPVLQYLTAAGVGTLGIIDFDTIDQSNLQRQILYTINDVGQPKAIIAKKRLRQLNPYITINAYNQKLSTQNAIELFQQYDIIVDGSDNFSTRYLVNDACVLTNKPLVSGSIFKFEGQVTVFNYKGSATYRCLYPTPPNPEDTPTCSQVGVIGTLPAIIGGFQANEVIKMICEMGTVLSNQLLIYNTLTMQQLILNYRKNEDLKITELEQNYDLFCGIASTYKTITKQAFEQQQDLYFLMDVREDWEREPNDKGVHIPLHELPAKLNELDTTKPIVVYCQNGQRSKIAYKILKEELSHIDLYILK